MSGRSWNKVPLGRHAPRWTTVPARRTVLVVVHTVTAVNRLADILSVFDSDRRVQQIFTFPDASYIPGDVEHELVEGGAIVVPWEQAIGARFDLAISVHNSGNLHLIKAPLAILSHGMGYTKLRKTENGKRKTENGSVYGLDPESLLRDGQVVPGVIVLSHDEQRARLANATPAAVDRAVVAGDPCFDRMRASIGRRDRYRRVLGAAPGSTVVVVSSTWGDSSLLGRHPDLVSELVAELTMDDHVVAAVLHPNAWFGHGPWQIRYWLADALRSGLRLIPPVRGWQQAIVAADAVIGDNGAVTGYATAIGVPTLLAAYPSDEVAPGSAIDMLGRSMPRLRHDRPYADQVHTAMRTADPARWSGVATLTSSVPDQSAQLLRATFYRLMNLPEPDHDAPVFPYPPEELCPMRGAAQAMWIACDWIGADLVRVRRWPADVLARRRRGPRALDTYLVSDSDHPRRDLRNNAAVIMLPREPDPDGTGDRLARTLRQRVSCTVAMATTGKHRYLAYHRVHGRMVIRPLTRPARGVEPAVFAAVAYSWWSRPERPPTVLTVRLGSQTITLALTPV